MEGFSIAAIIISICALSLTFYESVQARKSYREQTYQGFVGTWFELGKIFIEHPELRPYFYDDFILTEDDENYQRVLAIAVFYDDCFAYAESQAARIPVDLKESYDEYKKRVKDMDAYKKYKKKYPWINNRLKIK